MRISNYYRWLWYLGYVVVCTVVLLVLHFPGDDIAAHLTALVAQKSPETPLLIRGVQPTFPLGVRVAHVELDQVGLDASRNILTADNIVLKAGIFSLLRGRYLMNFSGDLYGGGAAGEIKRVDGTSDSISAELHLLGINADKLQLLMDVAGVKLTSVISGNINYTGGLSLPPDGRGESKFEFGRGEISLVKPLFGFTETVLVDKMTLTLSLNNGTLQTKLIFSGPELVSELSGSIRLLTDIMQSEMNIKGQISGNPHFLKDDAPASGPGMALLKKRLQTKDISFLLLGTVAEPRIRLR